MKNSNLDVWAIQSLKEEIHNALANVTSSSTNILFRNCLCTFKIEDTNMNILFDTMFYGEDSDTLILLMRNGALTDQELKEELDKRNINYNEVVFDDLDFNYQEDKNFRDIWFARENYVLIDALQDSKDKGIKKCTYYPNVTGNLEMEYLTSLLSKEKVDGRTTEGLIELEDKIVLLINQDDERNIGMREVFQITESIGTMTNVDMSREVESIKKNKQYLKRDK